MGIEAIFHHLSGSRQGQVDRFDMDLMTVGRDPSNTVYFDSEKDIRCSGNHAEVRREGARFLLADVGARNGTFVNGQRVTRKELVKGDVIQFGNGGPKVRFDVAGRVPPTPAAPGTPVYSPPAEGKQRQAWPQGAGMVDRDASTRERAVAAEDATGPQTGLRGPAAAEPRRGARAPSHVATERVAEKPAGPPDPVRETRGISVEHLSPRRAGQVTDFPQGVIRVGRNAEFELAFDADKDTIVSWTHAEIVYEGPDWFVEDLGSRNGTYVNGRREKRRQLKDGDVVQFGMNGPEVRVRLLSVRTDRVPTPGEPMPSMTGEWAQVSDKRVKDGEKPTPVRLNGECLIGRDRPCQLVLEHPSVSRRHAAVRRGKGGYVIEDLGSTNGTFLNGERLTSGKTRRLRKDDRIYLGAYMITFDGSRLVTQDQQGNIRVAAHRLTEEVRTRAAGGKLRILDDVSLVIQPREFVGLLGPSGAGKSTFMALLSGRRRPTSGEVYYNGDDFAGFYDHYRSAIGYVPQQDIVHRELTVFQALKYTVRLRLPRDTSRDDLNTCVEEVLQLTELETRKKARIRDLSGGELKRVNLAVELISKPNVLFLDEATSGLDAGTDREMMELFRNIANEGKTVICITHNVEFVDLCDLVVLLHQGKLVYYGPPKEMLGYFGVERVSEAYKEVRKHSAEELSAKFKETPYYEQYVVERQERQREKPGDEGRPKPAAPRRPMPGMLRQFHTLTCRQVRAMSKDWLHMMILLAQAPIIAGLVALGFCAGEAEAAYALVGEKVKIAFFMVLSAVWFGCTNGVYEFVKESEIYARERSVNLRIPPYVLSKVAPLAFICAVQCVIMVSMLQWLTGLGGDMEMQFWVMLATAVTALLMGLLVSAIAATGSRAGGMIPILLIPQVVFADAVLMLKGAPHWVGRFGVVAYWAFRAIKTSILDVPIGVAGIPLRSVAQPGLPGQDQFAMIGRVSENIAVELGVLGVFAAVFLLLIMASLRLKDEER